MEYTKDIILNLNYKKEIESSRLKDWTNNAKKIIKNNKLAIIILSLLFTLMSIDLILVNSFLQLLNKIY